MENIWKKKKGKSREIKKNKVKEKSRRGSIDGE